MASAHSSSHPLTRSSRRSGRVRRPLAAAGLLLASLALGACGFNVQTNQPYNQSEGVNADVGSYQTQPAVKVRNLMVLTRESGQGFLSATLYAADRDALTAVTATALKADGTKGSSLQVSVPDPVALSATGFVVLTDRTQIPVTGTLTPGLNVELTLTFESAGRLTITAPIVSADTHEYQTVSPSPAPSAGQP